MIQKYFFFFCGSTVPVGTGSGAELELGVLELKGSQSLHALSDQLLTLGYLGVQLLPGGLLRGQLCLQLLDRQVER